MHTVLEMLTVVLAVLFLLAAGWTLFERLITPVGPGPVYALVPAAGEGVGLEQTVKGLLWLGGAGGSDLVVVIVDRGLDPAGRRLAELLCRRQERVRLCLPEELAELT